MNAPIEQKTQTHLKRRTGGMWILGESAGTSYLSSQCQGQAGIDQDLRAGWLVKAIWEDSERIVFLLERHI